MYHSTLGLRVIKKKKKVGGAPPPLQTPSTKMHAVVCREELSAAGITSGSGMVVAVQCEEDLGGAHLLLFKHL